MESIIRSELFENSIYQKKYSRDFLTDEIIEKDIDIDTEYVTGVIKELQLDGLFLSNTNINAPLGHCFEVANNFPVFILHFEFSGDYSYTPTNEKKPLVEISDFQYNMVYLPNSNGILKYKGNPLRSLEIHFTLDRIKKIAGDDYTEVLKKVNAAVISGEPYVFWKKSRPISPELENTLENLIACPLCGHLKKTYLH